jgi:hypothetical protein
MVWEGNSESASMEKCRRICWEEVLETVPKKPKFI